MNLRVGLANTRCQVTYHTSRFLKAVKNISNTVKDGETVKHYRIRYGGVKEGGIPCYFIARRTPFESLADLVQHYQDDADGLCSNLTQPCAQVNIVQLQLLSLECV